MPVTVYEFTPEPEENATQPRLLRLIIFSLIALVISAQLLLLFKPHSTPHSVLSQTTTQKPR